MSVKPAKITIEQWHKILDSGVFDRSRVELIEGLILEIPPEKPHHSGKILRLSDRFKQIFANRSLIISQGHPITLNNSEAQPDIAILKYSDRYYEDKHPTVSDVYLVVEVANTSLNFDKLNKKQVYAKAGIIEYWSVDLNKKELIVHRDPVNLDYNSSESKQEDRLSLLAFPNIEIEVSSIF